ncbi:acyl-CoA dehydrogenase family protein [Actinomadura sp. 6N118]|uniref:acyl-CoA dehydrogenase family protein n=1 Tax=Actinomadura sp. 6N118 TaxID=3375151 RepID=UPI003789B9C6
MFFALSDEQSELAATVRSLLERRADSAAVRRAVASPAGYDPALWQTLCEQIGAAALAVPELYGGAGFTLMETHIVLECLGYALAPSPMLGSAVLATQALLRSGNAKVCARLLPELAAGSTTAALAWATGDGRWPTDRSDVRADEEPDGRAALTGTAHLVLDGATADTLIVVAERADGIALYKVDPSAEGVLRARTPGLDPTLRFARLNLHSAPARLITADASMLLAGLHDVAAVAVTALQLGTARRALDMTVRYAGERVQFGRPIGSFQALKHRMADMHVAVETSRTLSWAAAWSAATESPDLSSRASTAKAWCSDALSDVASETVQLHGGIAITWEHDAHLVFKRAHATAQLFGQPHEHRRRYFTELAGTPA